MGSISLLADGPTNTSFRIARDGDCYVLRVDKRMAADIGLDRSSEASICRTASAKGLAPKIRQALPAQGLQIRDWVPGAPWSRRELLEPRSLRRLGQLIRGIHRLPPRGGSARPLYAVDRYARAIASTAAREAQNEARRLYRRLATTNAPRSMCHNDLVHSNIIDGPVLMAIDWEYAGLSISWLDLAVVMEHHAMPEAGRQVLCEAYLGRFPNDREQNQLDLACRFYAVLGNLWNQYLAVKGEN